MGKPTVHDIARDAGVSLATVDRVLNGRPGVRQKTVEKVNGAVERLGYVRDINAANLARQRFYRFVFLLPEGKSQFLSSLEAAVRDAASSLIGHRCEVDVIRTDFSETSISKDLMPHLVEVKADGVAVMGDETQSVRNMIADLKATGVSVVALVTDQSGSERDHFVGIDNVAAGKTAGVLMGRYLGGRAGRVAVVVNTKQSRDMVERRMGFDQIMGDQFPVVEVLDSVEGRDDQDQVARVLEDTLDQRGPIAGIYCAGAGTRGVTRVIRDRALTDEVVVVAHELTPHCREALKDGTIDVIINQNVGHIARSAVRILRAKCDDVAINANQEKIRIEIAIRENLT